MVPSSMMASRNVWLRITLSVTYRMRNHRLRDFAGWYGCGVERSRTLAASELTQAARYVGTLLFSDILNFTLVAEVKAMRRGSTSSTNRMPPPTATSPDSGGRIINPPGDGILGVSDALGQAVQCALAPPVVTIAATPDRCDAPDRWADQRSVVSRPKDRPP